MNCLNQQRVVKRDSRGQTIHFRCLKNGVNVSEAICNTCPLKVVKHVKPCIKPFNTYPLNINHSTKRPNYPPLTVQLVTWKTAIEKWRKAGRPKRSDAQVKTILEICKTCSWYDPDKRRCKGCGCAVTNGGIAVLNKIRMASESCPQDKW